jgi:hypothetical protein
MELQKKAVLLVLGCAELSVQQDKKAPVSFNALANAGGKFNSQYGAYLPGTKALYKEVKDGGKDDQVGRP